MSTNHFSGGSPSKNHSQITSVLFGLFGQPFSTQKKLRNVNPSMDVIGWHTAPLGLVKRNQPRLVNPSPGRLQATRCSGVSPPKKQKTKKKKGATPAVVQVLISCIPPALVLPEGRGQPQQGQDDEEVIAVAPNQRHRLLLQPSRSGPLPHFGHSSHRKIGTPRMRDLFKWKNKKRVRHFEKPAQFARGTMDAPKSALKSGIPTQP